MRVFSVKPRVGKTDFLKRIINGRQVFLIILVFGVSLAFSASASFTSNINYQGKLTDSSGNAVSDGTYNMRFRLCTASASGACSGSVVFDESFLDSNKVTVTDGLFSVMLGSVSSTLSSLNFNQNLYLEVSVGGTGSPSFETLSPVKQLGAVPNAFNAQNFDGLATTSFLRADITNASATINYLNTTNATTSGYLTVGGAPVGANFTPGSLNVQNYLVVPYVSSTALTVSGESFFTTTTVSCLIGGVLGSGMEYDLCGREGSSLPVPSFRPHNGGALALDIMPGGAAPAENSDNGYAWIDVVDNDLLMASGTATTALRLGNRSTYLEVGSRQFNSGTLKALALTMDATPVLVINTDSRVSVGSTTAVSQFSVEKNQNSNTGITALNTNSGASAFAYVGAKNVDGLARIMAMGANYTTNGAYMADSGVLDIGSGLSNGLSIIAGGSTADIRFYAGGFADATNKVAKFGYDKTLTVYGTSTLATTSISNLTVSSNATTSGYLTVGAAPSGANFSSGNLNVQNAAVIGTTLSAGTSTLTNLIVTNVSTSTFAGGLTVGTSQFVVQQGTGNVGIGTAAPQTKLHINQTSNGGAGGILTLQNTSDETANSYTGTLFNIAAYGGIYAKGGIFYNIPASGYTGYGRGDIVFAQELNANTTNASPANAVMTIKNSGNVGIGTASPQKLLDVVASRPDIFIRSNNNSVNPNDVLGSLLFFSADDSTAGEGSRVAAGVRLTAVDQYGPTRLEFTAGTSNPIVGYGDPEDYTDNSIVRMSILGANGNVGIGIFSPTSTLTVNGNFALWNAGANKFTVDTSGNATTTGYLTVGTAPTGVSYNAGDLNVQDGIVAGGSLTRSQSTGGNSLVVDTNGLVYDSTNNRVGIGTSTPQSTLHLIGAERIQGISTAAGYGLIYHNATAVLDYGLILYKGNGTNEEARITLGGFDNGYSGQSISFTIGNSSSKKMVLNNNGFLGIGTTNPLSQLSVASTSAGITKQISLDYPGANNDGATIDWRTNSSIPIASIQHKRVATGDYSLSFFNWSGSANTERLTLRTNGNFGIGTTTPNSLLQVGNATQYFKVSSAGNATTTGYMAVGSGAAATDSFIDFELAGVTKWTMGNDATNNNFVIATGTALGTGNVLTISSTTGDVTIGNSTVASSTSKFAVVISGSSIWGGVNNTTGAWMNGSDIRLKQDISDLEDPLQKVLGLRPVRYNWISENPSTTTGQHIGFIAQEVENLFPQLVGNLGGYKSLSYAEFAPILTGAIQQQQKEIDLLKSRLSSTTPVSSDSGGQITIAVSETDPQFNTLRVSQAANFYGTITVMGEAGFEDKVVFKKDVEIEGKLYLDKDQAGTIMVVAGSTTAGVIFDKQYNSIPKVIANLNASTSTVFVRFAVADKTVNGFKIILDQPASEDLSFDWIALGLRGTVAGVEEISITGCTDPAANNYDPEATVSDESCQFDAIGNPPIEESPATTTPPTDTPSATTTPAEVAESPVIPPETEVIEPPTPVVEASPVEENNVPDALPSTLE